MAQPTNTFDTYDAKGNREDLQDKIYMVTPEKTPVLSAIQRFKAKSTFHEWQRDALAAPNKDNAVIEGDDRTGNALTPTERVGNYTQLFDAVAVVTSAQEKTVKAGRSSEMKLQVSKKMSELKRDIEAMILSNNAAVAGNSITARKSGGLGVFLFTNASHGTGTPNGSTAAHTSGAPTTAPTASGTLRTFAESQLKTVMQSIYTNSGDMPSLLVMTPSHKQTFSGFAGIAVNRKEVAKGKQAVIVGGADVYMSDFGELTVVPNYVQSTSNPNTVFVLNPEEAGVAYFCDFKSEALAKTGHTAKELVSVECALVVTSEKAHGKIADLTA
jgi:hypothetical protein